MLAACGCYWLVRLEQAAVAAREMTACTLMHTSELNLYVVQSSVVARAHEQRDATLTGT